MTDPSVPNNDLAATGRELRVAVEELGYAVTGLAARVQRNRKAVGWIATSLLLDVVLTIIVSALLAQQSGLSTRQAEVTNGALCPLYSLMLGSVSPAARARYAQGPEAYDHAFVVIRQGAAALHCTTG